MIAKVTMTYTRLHFLNFIRCWIGLSMLGCGLAAMAQSPSSASSASSAVDTERKSDRNVLLVTLDGMRWQDVFRGADRRLVSTEAGAKNIRETQERFVVEDPVAAREKLMPFLWSNVAAEGVLYGDPAQESSVRVTNNRHFSYPGYSELLCGRADPAIDSNAKEYNENVTVLEWLDSQTDLHGRVAAFCSWDVFPFIINDKRSGVLVNAGWAPVADIIPAGDPADQHAHAELQRLDALAAEIPHLWSSVRYDYFTFKAAQVYLQTQRPRVMYVSFGETDDWAHEGRYDLYLESAQRNDDYIRQLWETIQTMDGYRDNTTLIITSDHGRGDDRTSWKSHSTSIPGCDVIWAAAMGPGIQPGHAGHLQLTQSQIAATVAAVLGYDFTESNPAVAKPLPCVPGLAKQE
ncbi:alkaline phosphatase family protein [Allorhodopirellula heiligendammensis]|uniref:Type I phosphodiesterase / nucleotide pyrophosphatase n=1 Tax=Allorhodopirellula heiligendammensis TaxID=2714739 RepID=A0A5C6BHV0_9BACT|nr:alkaline phosphatase family protein [Allorhodopirellula heiligendammensis]TWU11121.1 Type I phosphodiesterase / nucleotide pyrophosphatase [Allorhodopirellula heiligendammensis]